MKKQSAIPHDATAESYVIGTLMLHPTLIDECGELTAEYFFLPAHQTVLAAIVAIRASGGSPDLLTVTQRLTERGEIEQVGGPGVLTEMYSNGGGRDLSYHITILRGYMVRRRIIEAASRMLSAAKDPAADVEEVLADAGESVLSVSTEGPHSGSTHVGYVTDEAMADIEQAMASRGKPMGLATGFHDFDLLTGGLREGQLMLIAGRPAMGKSAMLINMADRMVAAGTPVLLFSLEMPAKSIATRIVMGRTRCSAARCRNGAIGDRDAKRIANSFYQLHEQPLYIDEARGCHIMEMRSRARREMRRHGIKCVMVDYAQLIEAKGYNTSYERVSTVSRGLKAMALELGVPVIAAAQIGRKSETRTENRPFMSDLKDSGSLEQDADIVSLLHRPGYYESGTGGDSADEQEAEWNIAKHREGQTKTFKMVWTPACTRFDHAIKEDRLIDKPPVEYGAQPALHEVYAAINE